MDAIDMLRQERGLIVRALEGLGDDQLLAIPEGHRNNILWNAGHIVVVQQLLHYRRSGIKTYVSDDMVAQFSRGTSPADWTHTPDVAQVRSLLLELPERLCEDATAGRFGTYDSYTSSTGVTLACFEDAVAFNHFHEGLHTGVIMSLRKLV